MQLSKSSSSYRQIMRSSSIMGGASGINYLVGLVRVKIVAVLLGPSGVGMVSLYISAIGLIGTVTSVGIGSSGVREVAQAYGAQDHIAAARTVLILRRVCWLTGALGWGMTAAMAPWLNDWVFGTIDHTLFIALLGITLLLGAVSNGQMALIQGVRRISDIARANVAGMLINTGVTIGLYAWLGAQGIVPVLIGTAAVSLAVSWWFARRVNVEPVQLSWAETLIGMRRLAGLGMAFMWSGVMLAGLDMFTRTIITREHGIDAAGIYQAAWALSGLFAGFILSAMGTDFYPRLTGVIHDHEAAVRIVNEQTEIGALLALPGLLGTLALSPWLLELFYTKSFLPGAALLPWFVVGIFGRIVSWPLGFIQLATGASRWFAATETIFIGLQIGMVAWAVPRFGIVGAAYAFAVTYFIHSVGMLWVAKRLIGFYWSVGVKKLLAMSAAMVLVGLVIRLGLVGAPSVIAGSGLTLIAGVFSLRGLASRLGAEHRLIRMVGCLPLGKWIAKLH